MALYYDDKLNVAVIRGSAEFLSALISDIKMQISLGHYHKSNKVIPSRSERISFETDSNGSIIRYYNEKISSTLIHSLTITSGGIINSSDLFEADFNLGDNVKTGLIFFDSPTGEWYDYSVDYTNLVFDSTNYIDRYIDRLYAPTIVGVPKYRSTSQGKWGLPLLPGTWLGPEYVYKHILPKENYDSSGEVLAALTWLKPNSNYILENISGLAEQFDLRYDRLFNVNPLEIYSDVSYPTLSLTAFKDYLKLNNPASLEDYSSTVFYYPEVTDHRPVTWGFTPSYWGQQNLKRRFFNSTSPSVSNTPSAPTLLAVDGTYLWASEPFSVDIDFWNFPPVYTALIENKVPIGVGYPFTCDDPDDPILFTIIIDKSEGGVYLDAETPVINFCDFITAMYVSNLNPEEAASFNPITFDWSTIRSVGYRGEKPLPIEYWMSLWVWLSETNDTLGNLPDNIVATLFPNIETSFEDFKKLWQTDFSDDIKSISDFLNVYNKLTVNNLQNEIFKIGKLFPYPRLSALIQDLNPWVNQTKDISGHLFIPHLNIDYSFDQTLVITPSSYVVYFRYSDLQAAVSSDIISISSPDIRDNTIYITENELKPAFKIEPYTSLGSGGRNKVPRLVTDLVAKIKGPISLYQEEVEILEIFEPLDEVTEYIFFNKNDLDVQRYQLSNILLGTCDISPTKRVADSNAEIDLYKQYFEYDPESSLIAAAHTPVELPISGFKGGVSIILNDNYTVINGKVTYKSEGDYRRLKDNLDYIIGKVNSCIDFSSDEIIKKMYGVSKRLLNSENELNNLNDPEGHYDYFSIYASLYNEIRNWFIRIFEINTALFEDDSRQVNIEEFILLITDIKTGLVDSSLFDYELSNLLLFHLKDYYMWSVINNCSTIRTDLLDLIVYFQEKAYTQELLTDINKQHRVDFFKKLVQLLMTRFEDLSDNKLKQWTFHELQLAKRQLVFYRDIYSMNVDSGTINTAVSKILEYESDVVFEIDNDWYEAQFNFSYAKVLAIFELQEFESIGEILFLIYDLEFLKTFVENDDLLGTTELSDAYAKYASFSVTRTDEAVFNRLRAHDQSQSLISTTDTFTFYKLLAARRFIWLMAIDKNILDRSDGTTLFESSRDVFFTKCVTFLNSEIDSEAEGALLLANAANIAHSVVCFKDNIINALGSKIYQAYLIKKLLRTLDEYLLIFSILNYSTEISGFLSKCSSSAYWSVYADKIARSSITQANINTLGNNITYELDLSYRSLGNWPLLTEFHFNNIKEDRVALRTYLKHLNLLELVSPEADHALYENQLITNIELTDYPASLALSVDEEYGSWCYYDCLIAKYAAEHLDYFADIPPTDINADELESFKFVRRGADAYRNALLFSDIVVDQLDSVCDSYYDIVAKVSTSSSTNETCVLSAAYLSSYISEMYNHSQELWLASHQEVEGSPYGNLSHHFYRITCLTENVEEAFNKLIFDNYSIDRFQFYNATDESDHNEMSSWISSWFQDASANFITISDRQHQILFWCDDNTSLRNETYISIAEVAKIKLDAIYNNTTLDKYIFKAEMKRHLDKINEMVFLSNYDGLTTGDYTALLVDAEAKIAATSGAATVRNTHLKCFYYFTHLCILHYRIANLYRLSHAPDTNVRYIPRHEAELAYYKAVYDERFTEIADAASDIQALQITDPIPSAEYLFLLWEATVIVATLQGYKDSWI